MLIIKHACIETYARLRERGQSLTKEIQLTEAETHSDMFEPTSKAEARSRQSGETMHNSGFPVAGSKPTSSPCLWTRIEQFHITGVAYVPKFDGLE